MDRTTPRISGSARTIPALAITALLLTPALASAAPIVRDEPLTDALAPAPTPTITVSRPTPSGHAITLEATAGYGAYLSPLGLDRVHGPTVNAALLVSWGSWPQLTVRVEGTYGRMKGRGENYTWDEPPTYEILDADLVALHAGLQATWRNGLWLASGVGALYYKTNTLPDDEYTSTERTNSSYFLPELVLQAGYNLHFNEAVALQLSVETASGVFTMNLRVQARCGLLVRF